MSHTRKGPLWGGERQRFRDQKRGDGKGQHTRKGEWDRGNPISPHIIIASRGRNLSVLARGCLRSRRVQPNEGQRRELLTPNKVTHVTGHNTTSTLVSVWRSVFRWLGRAPPDRHNLLDEPSRALPVYSLRGIKHKTKVEEPNTLDLEGKD